MKIMKRIGVLALTMLMLVSIMAPSVSMAGTSYIYRRLEYGDSGSDVTALQKNLKKLGFLSAKATGNYLDATQRAVKAFQNAYDYKRTNYCTEGMQLKIYNAAQSTTHRVLHYGDNGEDVKQLQKALKKLGYFNGTIGGNFLKKTRAAVNNLQRDFNLKVTKTCSVSLQKHIISLAKRAG